MKRKIAILAIFVSMFLVVACHKDIAEVPQPQKATVIDSFPIQALVTYNIPQNIVGYQVNQSIMANFQHFCQKNAGPATPAYPSAQGTLSSSASSSACGPTAYMMAAAAIAKTQDPNTLYECNATKLANIIKTTGTTINVIKALTYGKVQDKNIVKVLDNFGYYSSANNPASPKISADRAKTKTFMQNELGNDRFLIVPLNIYFAFEIVNDPRFYNNDVTNPDLNDYGVVTTGPNKNYINNRNENVYGVGGHIVCVTKITVNANGFGVVEYIDPLAKPRFDTNGNPLSNKRYCSYTRFLDSMEENGGSPNYDVISIGAK